MFRAKGTIAEHTVRFETDSEGTFDWLHETFGLSPIIVRDTEDRQELNICVYSDYGEPFAGFDVKTTATETHISYERVDYRIDVDKDYHNAEIRVYDIFALKHALMNLYSAFIVHAGWGLLIHSSCVIEDGNAYIFSGRSGAGKSTIARLSSPRPLLSDEATIVKIGRDAVTVFDSPFRSDTRPEFRREGYPLAGIHLIHQATYVNRIKTNQTQGIFHLMDKVFYWSHDKSETRRILKMYEQLAHLVPIYDLHFPKNNTFWEAIS